MNFILKLFFLLAIIGFLAVVAAAVLAVIWLSKKALTKGDSK